MASKLENAIRLLTSPEYREHRRIFRKEYHDLARLAALERYTPGETILRGHRVYFPDAASYLFTRTEIFEKEIYCFDTKTPHPLIIDAGANIGLASIYLKTRFPEARVIAFEPDEKIARFYEKNIQSFGFKGVDLIKKGLWSSEGDLQFSSEGADAGSIIDAGSKAANVISIPVTTLSPYLQEKVDFLKIDIEGAELAVLEECKDSLERVERLFVEYHSFEGQEQGLSRIFTILEQAGFRLHVSSPGLTSNRPLQTRHVYNGMDMQLNVYGFRP